MAIALSNSTSYESGSGGYNASHTISGFSCSGTDTLLLVWVYNRNPLSDVDSVTADGNAMTLEATEVNTNVCAVQLYSYKINNASFDIVCNTPSFKLAAMVAQCWTGVDQTTPVGTTTGTGAYSQDSSQSVTGTSGNYLATAVNWQGAQTLTLKSGMTGDKDFDHGDANLGQCASQYVAASGSAQTVGWTQSVGDDNWRLLTAEINEATASTPVSKLTLLGAN